jgi:hypothetical protein
MGEAEQPLSPLPAGVVHTAHGQVASVGYQAVKKSSFFGCLICGLKYIIENNKGIFL